MIPGRTRRPSRDAVSTILALTSLTFAACSGGGGGPTPPPPPPQPDAALRLAVDFDAAARGLQPAGFKVLDLSRIDLVVTGGSGGPKTIQLTPPQEATFLAVFAGNFTITATAYMGADLVLFTSAPQAVTVAKGDTADVRMAMQPALGDVAFEINGQRTGTIQATAGEAVPFAITVRNTQGRPVPNSAVVLTTTSTSFGSIQFTGSNATDAAGRVNGTIQAPHSGSLAGFNLTVDGRPIPLSADLRVDFATNVSAANSDIIGVSKTLVTADGVDSSEITVRVQNARGEPLPGIPIVATSSRNEGVERNVDVIVPGVEFASGRTDAFGLFRFSVRSRTSDFMELDAEGRLFSRADAGRVRHPSVIRVFADGVQIDQRNLNFDSVVNPTGAALNASPQFVNVVPGQGGFTTITVRVRELPAFGGGPAAGVFIEVTDALHVSHNYDWDVRPAPGFVDFRTNAEGEWQGRIFSSSPRELSIEAKADGRALTVVPRLVIFR